MPRVISKNWIRLLVIFLVAFSVTFVSATAVRSLLAQRQQPETNDNSDNSEPTEDAPAEQPAAPTVPDFINLQPTVDAWVATLPSATNIGLTIFDLDHDQIAGEYNPDEPFNTASVYKLFYVYDGYRQLESGAEDGETIFVTTPDKGPLSISACLDLMIRESYNGCADPMRADNSRTARVQAMRSELGLTNTSNAGLYSSTNDLTKLMQLYWDHPDLSAASWEAIKDSMLNQPATTYNWRQGLPSGFSTALVYDKVGWNWNGSRWTTYNDVAFVEFPEQNRHYIVAVITENLLTFSPLVRLGEMLESAILGNS